VSSDGAGLYPSDFFNARPVTQFFAFCLSALHRFSACIAHRRGPAETMRMSRREGCMWQLASEVQASVVTMMLTVAVKEGNRPMRHIFVKNALVAGLLGGLAACASSSPSTAASPQTSVPGSPATGDTPTEQAVADQAVIERIAAAHCDRSQSCDRIGPGANYRDREDCMSRVRARSGKELSASKCAGGIGERGLTRCEKSLRAGQCTAPGEEYGNTSHCDLNLICLH
jgi:hypothetical protein